MSSDRDDGAWFAPKRFGYGASLPIAWQGWLTLAAYVGTVALAGLLVKTGHSGGRVAALVVVMLATGLFMVVAARHTRGGWKWRWGGKN